MARVHAPQRADGYQFAIVGDQDTITGFLLAGVGEVDAKRNKNFFVVQGGGKTPVEAIEAAFKEFTTRPEIGAILVTQPVADQIRHVLQDYEKLIPTVLEIPSKDCAYDPEKDSVMQRVLRMTGQS